MVSKQKNFCARLRIATNEKRGSGPSHSPAEDESTTMKRNNEHFIAC